MSQFKKNTIEQFEAFLRIRMEDANVTITRLCGVVDFSDSSDEKTNECEDAFFQLSETRSALIALGDFKKSLVGGKA